MASRTSIPFLLFACLVPLLSLPAEGGDFVAPPLERPLRLDLWSAGFSDVVREIQSQTGVKILIYPPDLPRDRNTDNVYLVTGRVPLRTVLECLAARFSFRYRLSEEGNIELSKGYDWVGGEPALRIFYLDGLTAPGDGPEEARKILAECVKPLSLLPDSYSLRLEPYPLPGNPDHLRCAAVLPPLLAEYLDRMLRCLKGDAGDGLPEDRRGMAFRTDTDWQALLSRPAIMPPAGDLRSVLATIANQTDIAVMLTSPGSAHPVRPTELAGRSSGIGMATGDLAVRYNLGRRVVLAAGGMVFVPGENGDMVTDSRSREMHWSGLATVGLDAREAVAKAGGPHALLARLRRRVHPQIWRDPVCAMVYSPVTGRMAVTAPANVAAAVAEAVASPDFCAGPYNAFR